MKRRSSDVDQVIGWAMFIIAVFLLQLEQISARPLMDLTGDNRTDFTLLSVGGSGTNWKILQNPALPGPGQAFIRIFDYGSVNDSITPGDYFGDGKTEVSIWRAGTYFQTPFPQSGFGTTIYETWGSTNDNLGRTGDYDGDGKDDETVVRITSNQLYWWYKGSSGVNGVIPWGSTRAGFSALAFPGADFNGDARDEIVFCEIDTSNGIARWWIGNSVNGNLVTVIEWGNFNTDYVVAPADYTGDGVADVVVYRGGLSAANGGGTWWIRDTVTGTARVVSFGISAPNFINADLPVRGDYDGDGVHDIAVYRQSSKEFFWINSSAPHTYGSQQWGTVGNSNEVPLANFFVY